MSKHTPGPWLIAQGTDTFVYAPGDDGYNVFDLNVEGRSKFKDQHAANARLIAAAPELLEALKLVWSMFDDGRIVRNITNDHKPDWALKMLTFTRELQTIRAAIAKAEGLSPENAEVSQAPTLAGRDEKGGEGTTKEKA